MLRRLVALMLIFYFYSISAVAFVPEKPLRATVPVLSIDGAIGPAMSEYLVGEINKAHLDPQTPLIIITIDTPGGLSSSLRHINQRILSSTIPIACLVFPQGARAASAGTYILYACHYAAMSPATTLGAATPVNIASPNQNKSDDENNQSASAMEQKILNDAIAYIRSLAQLRNRNAQWAELSVSNAATLTATEALEENVINYVAASPQQLLEILFNENQLAVNSTADLDEIQLEEVRPDWRNQFIATITDPNIAYILLLIGIYGLILEFYSPGIGVAGITGAISLLIALYAFQLLPLNYSGIALLLLGIVLLIIESLAPSFGIWGFGGVIAFVLGSIFLIDTEQPEFLISIPLIAAFAFVSVVFFVFSLGLIWKKRHAKVVSGQEELIGAIAISEANYSTEGYILYNGERWAAVFTHPVLEGQQVRIININGLVLNATPIKKEE